MFWKKSKKSEEEDIIRCKGCGMVVTEGNAVLDVQTGSFVCKDCKNVGFDAKKAVKNEEPDFEAEMKAEIDKEKLQGRSQTKEEDEVISQKSFGYEEKAKIKCKKCGYVFSYFKNKGYPAACGYCGEKYS